MAGAPRFASVLRCFHKAVSAKDCLQLLRDHTSILALLFHHEHDTIRISHHQQIILNRECPVRISDIDAVLPSGYPGFGQGRLPIPSVRR